MIEASDAEDALELVDEGRYTEALRIVVRRH